MSRTPTAMCDTAWIPMARRYRLRMHIFFDVDYTILGRDYTLRPGTHDVFTRLREDGHQVYVWSGEGERWGVVRKHGLEELVDGVYGKPLHDYEARLGEFG